MGVSIHVLQIAILVCIFSTKVIAMPWYRYGFRPKGVFHVADQGPMMDQGDGKNFFMPI